MLHIFISFLQYLKWVFSLNVYLSNKFKLGHRSTDTPVLDFWWGLVTFQKQGGSLTWVLPCLCAMDFSDSPLMQLLRAVLITDLYKLVILNLDSINFWLWWSSLFPRQIAPYAVFCDFTYCLHFWGLSSFYRLLDCCQNSPRRVKEDASVQEEKKVPVSKTKEESLCKLLCCLV